MSGRNGTAAQGYHPSTVNLILGRGGVRGIGIAGAVCTLQEAGYRFDHVAGISSGAIVAALLAAGYDHGRLRRLVWTLDYGQLCDSSAFGRVPVVGPLWRLARQMGVYDGDVLLQTLRALLADRGVRTFDDLRRGATGDRFRLQVLAADVTRCRMVVLPDDAVDYGIAAGDLEVALALRMSASVPFLYRPVRFGVAGAESLIVDGGLLAGIPFGLFDWSRDGGRPTLGVQAGPGLARRPGRAVRGPVSLLVASYYTALAVNEPTRRSDLEHSRTIDVDCGAIAATRFHLREREKEALFEAGRAAALAYLNLRAPALAGGSESTACAPAHQPLLHILP